MSKKYFMLDQVRAKEKTVFGKVFFFIDAGIFIATIIVLSTSLFYVR